MPVKEPVAVPARVFNWAGFYVGIEGGGGWADTRHTNANTGGFSSTHEVGGGLFGGTYGYNAQLGSWVFGLEGDIDWVNSRGSCRAGAFVCSTASDYLATGRALVGFTFQNNLVGYITGGVALGNKMQSFSPPLLGNTGTLSNRVGWTAGIGVQYALWTPWSSNWSIKIEYLYVDLGTFSCPVACSGIPGQITSIRLWENVFRTGINYRF
jgi:outer membrane immunogenic protein